MEAEDEHVEDTCRICAAPAEPDAPLFYPCKCSGTIRYIHQDCLSTWLVHSKKKSCDVCKHPYSFTKVYAPDMPANIPTFLFLQRLISHVVNGTILVLRAILVGTVWLALVPYGTVWAWRFFFWLGDQIAWVAHGTPRVSFNDTILDQPDPTTLNTTVSAPTNQTSNTTDPYAHTRAVVRKVSSDIFTGQIIASLVVIAFLAIFLLREWIIQNARPGVFDDEEGVQGELVQGDDDLPVLLPPNDAAAAQVDQAPQIQQVQPEHHDDTEHPPPLEAIDSDSDVEGTKFPLPADVNDLDPRRDAPQNGDNSFIGTSSQATGSLYSPPPSPPGKPYKKLRLTPSFEEETPTDFDRTPTRAEIRERRAARWKELLPDADRQKLADALVASAVLANDYKNTELGLATNAEDHKPSAQSVEQIKELEQITMALFESAAKIPGVKIDPGHLPLPPSPPPGPASPDTEAPPPAFPIFLSHHQPSSFRPGALHSSYEPTRNPAGDSGFHHPDFEFTFKQSPPKSIKGKEKDDTSSSSLASSENGDAGDDSAIIRTGVLSSPMERVPRIFTPGERAAPLLPTPTRRPPLPPTTPVSDLPSIPSSSNTLPVPRDISAGTATPPLASPSLTIYRAPEELGAIPHDDAGYFVEPQPVLDAQPQVLPLPQAILPVVPIAPAAAGDDVLPDQDWNNDDMAEGVEDDMDGALEAIGMRGPLNAVVQNGSMMFIILGLTILAAIGVPYTLGKTVALLAMEPRRILSLLHLPIRGVRLVTDPIVDYTGIFGRRIMVYLFRYMAKPFWSSAKTVSTALGKESILRWAGQYVVVTPSGVLKWNGPALANSLRHAKVALLTTIKSQAKLKPVSPRPPLEMLVPTRFQPLVLLCKERLALTALALAERWKKIALTSSPPEKVFATSLGYMVIGLAILLYLYLMRPGHNNGPANMLRIAVKQQAIVFKVAVFILVELALFPVGCGVVLDLCTLPLFPEASLASRIRFYQYARTTSVFYHWMLGTMFMYQFALLLGVCRHIMRKGAIWFIKDPRDQNFHPIRDILEKPTFYQVRKISSSAALYSFVIVGGIGSVLAYLRYAPSTFAGLLPLRWNMREPLSEIPIDLLFVQVVIPPTLAYFEPKDFLLAWFTRYWKFLAGELRLRSYMFGGRYHEEEAPSQWTWKALPIVRLQPWVIERRASRPTADRDGAFVRCPAVDNIERTPDTQILITVNEFGQALTEKGRKTIEDQDREARNAHRNPQEDYTIVYTPPHFRMRIIGFIATIWFTCAVGCVITLAGPIFIGRALFDRILTRQVHDGYSFIVGSYIFWGMILTAKKYLMTRSDHAWFCLLKRGGLWLSQVIWISFWMGLVLPLLVSLVVDAYILLTIRSSLKKNDTPTIHIWEEWALGVVFARIGMRLMELQPPTEYSRALNRIADNLFTAPNAVAATKDFIAPVAGGMVAMILLPPTLVYGALKILPIEFDEKVPLWACYTPLFIAGCMIHIHKQLSRAGRVWSQAVRDREFLVELKLKNLEPEDIAVAKAKKAACRKREMEGGDTDSDVSEDEGDEEVEEEEGR